MDAAEQDELGDAERRIDRLDIVEHALPALVAGAAERDEVGRRVVPRQAERDDVVRLTLLAPDIVDAVLDGRTGPEITLARLLEPFPVEWREQATTIGGETN